MSISRAKPIDLESTNAEGWWGRRDRERCFTELTDVTVCVTTGANGMVVELRDFEDTPMDVDDLERAITLYRTVEAELLTREMNRGNDPDR